MSRNPSIGPAAPGRSMHHATIVTPEAVLLEFRAAGIASRMLAKMIDLAVQAGALIVLLITAGFLSVVGSTPALIVTLVGTFLIVFGYPTIEAFWNGQTIGKRALGLRVITVEGSPIKLHHAAVRSIVAVVEFLIPPGGLPAVVAALVSRRSQRIGDLAAGTVVVRTPKATTRPNFWAPARGAEGFSFTFDAGRLTAAQYAVVREFLFRAPEFDGLARGALAHGLAHWAEQWTGWPRPSNVGAEDYLLSAAFAYQRRFGEPPVAAARPGLAFLAPPSADTVVPAPAPT